MMLVKFLLLLRKILYYYFTFDKYLSGHGFCCFFRLNLLPALIVFVRKPSRPLPWLVFSLNFLLPALSQWSGEVGNNVRG